MLGFAIPAHSRVRLGWYCCSKYHSLSHNKQDKLSESGEREKNLGGKCETFVLPIFGFVGQHWHFPGLHGQDFIQGLHATLTYVSSNLCIQF